MNREQRRRADKRRGGRASKVALVGGSAAITVAGQLVLAPAAHAATFTVTNLADAGSGSLRQAIEDANLAPGADTITFQSGLSGTITLTSGQIRIEDSLTITGPGVEVLAVDGDDSSRIFYLYSIDGALDVTITGLTLQHGSAESGGAILNINSQLTLTDMVLTENQAEVGGALAAGGGANQGPTLLHLTVESSAFIENRSDDDGGAIFINDTAGMTISSSILSGNSSDDSGGAISFYDTEGDVTISDTLISGNVADDAGGGIYLYDTDSGVLRIERSTISGNSSERGGGLFFYEPDTPITVAETTISGNTSSGDGGGIYVERTFAGFTVESSTVSGNTAADDGGGLHVDGYAIGLAIGHSTIAGNGAGLYGGGIALSGVFYDVSLDHTIVADNTATWSPDIASCGCPIDTNWSLVEDPAGSDLDGIGNITGVDPLLGALANNGGPTQTHALLPGSPAIDAGDPDFTPPPATDQRGADRVVGPVIDIGAFEALGPAVDDTATTAEDTPLVVPAPGVLVNDQGGTGATVALVTGPTNGTLALNPDGSYTYTPNANFSGTDSFTYAATTPFGSIGNATVTITVTPAADPPVAVDQTASVTAGQSVVVDVLAGSSDPEGDPLTVVSATQGTRGTTVVEGNMVRYTPSGTEAGTDTFQYTISDGQLTATANVTVTIAAAPAPPPTTTTTTSPPSANVNNRDQSAGGTPSSGNLPTTGGNPMPLGTAGAGLLGVGAALVAAARRKARRTDG